MYLVEFLSDHLNDKSAEQMNDSVMEYAAPRLPYCGTNTKKATIKLTTLTDPIAKSFLCSFKLLNFEIAFDNITEGRIPAASITSESATVTYSASRIESILAGNTINAAIIGAVKLKPILRLLEDSSVFIADEAGIAMYARLDPKLLTTKLIIIAI
jgi:hypothetical protein